MLQRKTIVFLILATVLPVNAQENEIFKQSSRINLQYAGNIGLFSAGMGKTFFNGRLLSDLHYGYLPKKSRTRVHTFAVKTSLIITKIELPAHHGHFYAGLSAAYSLTDNTYLRYPSYFPNSYYDFPNSLHFHPYAGLLFYDPRRPMGWYIELGSSDYKIIALTRNQNLGFRSVINISFGISYFWEKR